MKLEFRVIGIERRNPYLIAGIDDVIFNNVAKGGIPTLIYHDWEPSVSISANQDINDLNIDNCQKRGYSIIRMRSGGRAVVHTTDTDFSYSLFLPFSYFSFDPSKNLVRVYDTYCQKIAEALQKIGVPAEVRNKNDVFVNNKKLSGNAQKIANGVVMQHGLILYKTPDINTMIDLMSPNLYNGNSVNELQTLLTSVSEYNKWPTELHELLKILTTSLVGDNYYEDSLTEEEMIRAIKFSENYRDPFKGNNGATVRGLCWLPRGAPLGTYKGENPNG